MYRSTLCSYFHITLLKVMKQIITMLYFQIAVDIIGLPIYLHHYMTKEIKQSSSKFLKKYNLHQFRITTRNY